MQLVQLVLTDDQALLNRQLIDLALSNSTEDQLGEAEADAQRLAVFFGAVAAQPEQFPVTGRMAAQLKTLQRKAKGPAQTETKRNKRKARQLKRQSFSKRRRAERAEYTAAYNVAREAMAAEAVEMEEAHAELRARLDAEPKFNITDVQGNVILAGVPSSMVVALDEAPENVVEHLLAERQEAGLDARERRIIMPGSAEALQAQLEAKQS